MSDALEALREILNTDAAIQRQQDERNRNRCPVRQWKNGKVNLATGETGGQYSRPCLVVSISGATIISSRTPIEGGSFSFNIPLPTKDMQADSEIGQTSLSLAALGLSNIIDIQGAVTDAIEAEYEYTGREWRDDPAGKLDSTRNPGTKGDFVDVLKTLTYYKFTRVAGGQTQTANGATAPLPASTIAAVSGYLQALADNGTDLDSMRSGDVLKQLQDCGINFQDAANYGLQSAVLGKRLVAFMAEQLAGATA